MEQGLTGNALGGYLYKKRVAIPGAGKSGGWRIIIATKLQSHWFVLHGFAKNSMANVDDDVLEALKFTSKTLLSFSQQDISDALQRGIFRELRGNS